MKIFKVSSSFDHWHVEADNAEEATREVEGVIEGCGPLTVEEVDESKLSKEERDLVWRGFQKYAHKPRVHYDWAHPYG